MKYKIYFCFIWLKCRLSIVGRQLLPNIILFMVLLASCSEPCPCLEAKKEQAFNSWTSVVDQMEERIEAGDSIKWSDESFELNNKYQAAYWDYKNNCE